MKKIAIVFNHFQVTDGVFRTAATMANALSQRGDIDVTLIPLFTYDKSMEGIVSEDVHIKPAFRTYFRGFAKLVDVIPDKILYRYIIRDYYDVEIGYCMELPIKIIAASTNKNAVHLSWMHGYDEGLTLRDFYRKFDKLICVSKHNCNRLKTEMPDYAERVFYQYNLMDDAKIILSSQEKVDLPERNNGLVFIAVGRQSSEKGYLRLVDVLYRLRSDGYVFNMWFIGDGPEHKALIEKTEEYNMCDCVSFLGEKANPHPYTKNADLFICSSFSEGYSTACVEACILGVPVLTTNVSGAEEIITDANAGIVVGCDDDSLYQGISRILLDKEIIFTWKQNLKSTSSVFSYKNRLSSLMKLLETL